MEVRIDNGPWGTVCRDSQPGPGLGYWSGQVACRQLNMSDGDVVDASQFGATTLKPVLKGAECDGVESRLTDCKLVPAPKDWIPQPVECQPLAGLRCAGGESDQAWAGPQEERALAQLLCCPACRTILACVASLLVAGFAAVLPGRWKSTRLQTGCAGPNRMQGRCPSRPRTCREMASVSGATLVGLCGCWAFCFPSHCVAGCFTVAAKFLNLLALPL